MNRGKKLAIGGAALVIISLWALFSSPDSVVVDSSGEINGSINALREKVQGLGFWENQLTQLHSELAVAQNFPDMMDQMKRDIDKSFEPVLEEMDQTMEDLYTKYPEMRPTPEEQQAEMLRKRADAIEAEESRQDMRRIFAERARELIAIRPVIQQNIREKGGR